MKKIKRNEKRESLVEALSAAQKLIFAPLVFQSIAALLDLGIIKQLDEHSATIPEIMQNLNLDEYTVRTLLQIAVLNGIVKESEGLYVLTKTGKAFLYDGMTIANFNFVKDVCYLGASELKNSFLSRAPKGLQKFVSDSPTIYPLVPSLPEKMRRSWYEFDHLYSDSCFDEVFKIITQKYRSIFDIGGNTGKFELVCLKNDKNFDITMLDLPEAVEKAKKNDALTNCKFYPVDVLSENVIYPDIKGCAVLMSQFLDCFSKVQIKKILTDLYNTVDENSSIFILEPYTDNQQFDAAEYALTHISLYFTCMANGVSKMYTIQEMKDIVESSGFKIVNITDKIEPFDYTLMECKKNESVVSNS